MSRCLVFCASATAIDFNLSKNGLRGARPELGSRLARPAGKGKRRQTDRVCHSRVNQPAGDRQGSVNQLSGTDSVRLVIRVVFMCSYRLLM